MSKTTYALYIFAFFFIVLGVVYISRAQEIVWPVDSRPVARVDLLGVMAEPTDIRFYQDSDDLRASYNGEVWVGPDQLGIKYWLTDIPDPGLALYIEIDGSLLCLDGANDICDPGEVSEPYIPDLIYISLFSSSLLNWDEAWQWHDAAGRTTYTVHDSTRGYWVALIPDTITYPSFAPEDSVAAVDVHWILLKLGEIDE